MKKYVALTGGIGSGKTTVGKVFSCLGIAVYDSDSHAKEIMNTNEQIRQQLIAVVGNDLYQNNMLQKDVMSRAIFGDDNIRGLVNKIVHQAVWNDYKLWSERQSSPYTIMETAVLFDSDLYTHFHKIVVVVADEQLRIQRVMQRNHCRANNVIERIKSQSSQEIAMQKADFVIENNNTFVLPQIIAVNNVLQTLWQN